MTIKTVFRWKISLLEAMLTPKLLLSHFSRVQLFDPMEPARVLRPWDSPGKNSEVGGFALLQGIFPTQGLNPGLLHCRWILYSLNHQGSLKILEGIAYPPFSRGFSQPRKLTGVSYIAGGFFTR